MNWIYKISFAFAVAFFAFFPLTDTDVWWHLACARNYLEQGLVLEDPFCWTPSRSPWINVHLYFQLALYGIYKMLGTGGLVLVKSFLWGIVAFLWVLPVQKRISFCTFSVAIFFAFVFRYALECRPILATMIFLGIFWNVLPRLLRPISFRWFLWAFLLLGVEWIWVRSQGLFPLGFVMSACAIFFAWKERQKGERFALTAFFVLLLLVPLLHSQGFWLWRYPFALLDRLMGGSYSAQIFAAEIAENRSPLTLLLNGENALSMLVLLLTILFSGWIILTQKFRSENFRVTWLLVVLFLAISAERNLTLFFFPFVAVALFETPFPLKTKKSVSKISLGDEKRASSWQSFWGTLLLAFVLGFFLRCLGAYRSDDGWMTVSENRVPFRALIYMQEHPLLECQKLFNDDRSGGYLEFFLPQEKTFLDGRFILKDSSFMATYLGFARKPETFFPAADSLGIFRALIPIRHIPLWQKLDSAFFENPDWKSVYRDDFYAVWER